MTLIYNPPQTTDALDAGFGLLRHMGNPAEVIGETSRTLRDGNTQTLATVLLGGERYAVVPLEHLVETDPSARLDAVSGLSGDVLDTEVRIEAEVRVTERATVRELRDLDPVAFDRAVGQDGLVSAVEDAAWEWQPLEGEVDDVYVSMPASLREAAP